MEQWFTLHGVKCVLLGQLIGHTKNFLHYMKLLIVYFRYFVQHNSRVDQELVLGIRNIDSNKNPKIIKSFIILMYVSAFLVNGCWAYLVSKKIKILPPLILSAYILQYLCIFIGAWTKMYQYIKNLLFNIYVSYQKMLKITFKVQLIIKISR